MSSSTSDIDDDIHLKKESNVKTLYVADKVKKESASVKNPHSTSSIVREEIVEDDHSDVDSDHKGVEQYFGKEKLKEELQDILGGMVRKDVTSL